MDCWPNKSATLGEYLNATDARFEKFLYDAGRSQWRYQVGMVGDGSDSLLNFHYAIKGAVERGNYVEGVSVFKDTGDPHVHLGANGFSV